MSMEYEWVDGYENGIYTDDMIFEVNKDTKQLQVITNQVMVSGENKSQFIRFQMPRYYDGIDLSTKNIQIIYITESGFSDINAAICVERNDENLRFGWLVPAAASYDVGVLSFSIEFVGDDYVLKTRVTNVEVYDGLNGGEVIPEPEEQNWYIELQQRCDYVLNQATAAKQAAAGSAEDAAASALGAAGIKTAVDNTKTLIDAVLTSLAASLEQIGLNKTDITTLTGRIDQALADYDASAETEIMDARVGHNGVTYTTLGAAIRGQFSELRLYVDDDGYICQSEST